MKHAYRWTALLALSLLSACGGGSHSSSPAPKTVTIGGGISGLTAAGLVLANGTATVSPAANATSFQFPTAVPAGTPYNVSVQTQPTGETCTITGAMGVANATVTSIAVSCSATTPPATYTIGGSISGLTAAGLVLLDNGSDTLAVVANARSFHFPTALGSGIGYDVTVQTPPTGETCTVTDGSGKVASSNVISVVVTCTLTTPPGAYTIGGTIEGLSASATGLVLLDNGGDALTVTQSGTAFPFTFATGLAGSTAYDVTVEAGHQPTGETCVVSGGTGVTASADVTGVIVSCSQYAAALGTNVVPITVGNGPAASMSQIFNVPYVTVTVCEPNPPNACATINNVEVDTGSVGLRLLASALANPDSGSPVTLQAIADPNPANSGNTISECWPFGGGTDAWGAIATANVQIGTETASNVEVQVINDDAPPMACSGTQYGTVSDFDANGVLGVGVLRQDCGAGCATPSGGEYYYTCTSSASSSCTQTPVGLATASQVPNPVTAFTASGDDNGVILQLPAIPDTGLPSANGYLVFGIGTQSDNTLTATTNLTADSTFGTFTTIYNGTTLTAGSGSGGIFDSGSNGLYFPDSSIMTCLGAADFFCPTSSVPLSAQNESAPSGTPTTVDFEIGDLETIAGGGSFAIDNAGGPQSGFFDWGLPFFYGQTVFVGIEGAGGTPPYYAY